MSKTKGSKKLLMILIIVGVVVFFGIIILINQLRPKKEVVPTVSAVVAEEGSIKEELDASGTIKSLKTMTFFSPVNAKINKMDVEVGDVIEKGSQVVAFDLKDLERDNQKAELNVLTGEYDYDDVVGQAAEADAKVANAQSNVDILQDSVDDWQNYVNELQNEILWANEDAQANAIAQAEDAVNSQSQTLAELENQLQAAWVELEAKEANREEKMEIYNNDKSNSDAESAFKKAEYDADIALRNYERKEKEYENFNSSGASGADAAADTLWLQQELENASGILAELKGELSSEEAIAESGGSTLTDAAKEKLEVSSNLSSLEAKSLEELIAEGKKGIQVDFKGVVADKKAVNGATVTQGMELFTLQSIDDVCVEVNVSKNDFDKVKKGQKADITLADSKYTGTVTKVDRIALPDEKGNTFIKATVKIDKPDENIFIGVDAKVVLHVAEVNNVVTVPQETVNIENEGSFCYAIENGKIVKKQVETGVSSTDTVEITSGLKKGDEVIADIGDFKEGDKVKGTEVTDEVLQEK